MTTVVLISSFFIFCNRKIELRVLQSNLFRSIYAFNESNHLKGQDPYNKILVKTVYWATSQDIGVQDTLKNVLAQLTNV